MGDEHGQYRVVCPNCDRIYYKDGKPTKKGHFYCGPCAYYLTPEKYNEPSDHEDKSVYNAQED